MSLTEEYLSSFTFSIFIEDISSELQLRRRYSENINDSVIKPQSARLSISTNDSLNNDKINAKHFSLSKFCPHFETYTSNGKLFNYAVASNSKEPKSNAGKTKKAFYVNLVKKITRISC